MTDGECQAGSCLLCLLEFKKAECLAPNTTFIPSRSMAQEPSPESNQAWSTEKKMAVCREWLVHCVHVLAAAMGTCITSA